VREGAVGFRHLVSVFTLLDGGATIIGRIHQFARKAIDHGGLVAVAGSRYQPADRQRLAALGANVLEDAAHGVTASVRAVGSSASRSAKAVTARTSQVTTSSRVEFDDAASQFSTTRMAPLADACAQHAEAVLLLDLETTGDDSGADPGNQSMGVMRATFVGANLSGADLSGANLYKADFSHADLTGAKLNGANLENADLVQTDLGQADLTGARFAKANIDGTNFRGATGVSRIRGLDQARNRDKAYFDEK